MWRAVSSSRLIEHARASVHAVRASAHISAALIVTAALAIGGAAFTTWAAYRAPERLVKPAHYKRPERPYIAPLPSPPPPIDRSRT